MPTKGQLLRVTALLLAMLLLPAPGSEAPAGTAPERPRLVLVLVIDQFRADYLERFRSRFGPDGFQRLLREGAYFTSCFYPYANTSTAPGHATLATGTTPDRHGIVSNEIFNPEAGKEAPAVEDASYPLVGAEGNIAGASPRNLLGDTLADELRLATQGQSKVFGVALKDRSAVFSTGFAANGAYWFNQRSGSFITSRYYRSELPAWVEAFNRERGPDRFYGQAWRVGERVLAPLTSASGGPDPEFYRRVARTPYGNRMVLELAQELIQQEQLGADTVTDFLFVGFSANDYVGHDWGPYSEAVEDMALRTDDQVAWLLRFLDEHVGTDNYWLVLSADHGVAPSLQQAWAQKFKASNVSVDSVHETVESALHARWGGRDWLTEASQGGDLYLNRARLRHEHAGLAEAATVAGEAATTVQGVIGYWSPHATNLPEDVARAFALSFYPGRNADVTVLVGAFSYLDEDETGGHHGSPYSYDQQVPLVLFGPAFRPGVYLERVAPTDLAPTLAAALRINPPALATGRILMQALRTSSKKSADAAGFE